MLNDQPQPRIILRQGMNLMDLEGKGVKVGTLNNGAGANVGITGAGHAFNNVNNAGNVAANAMPAQLLLIWLLLL